MSRTPVQQMAPDVLLRPTAAPSDIGFRAPAQVDAGANLRDLAQGLAKFDSGLNDYFQAEAEKKAGEDKLLAEADFHKQNGKGYAQGVADGTIPSFASKAYMETYKGLEGQQAGRVLEQKFWADYEKWGDKNSADPNAFQSFYNGWLKENISDTQDPKVLAGLLPRIRGLSEQATNKWIGDKDAATKKGMSDAAGAAAGNAIKDARQNALTSGKSIDYDGTYTKLDTLRTTLGANGRSDADNDKTMIDTVTAMALEQRDPRWLAYLDRKIPGKDYGLADTPYGRQNKQQTIDALDTIHRRGVSEAYTQKERQDKQTKEDATRKAVNFMLENPNKPIPEEVLAQGEKVDGSFRKDVLQWGEQLRGAKKSANTEAVAEVNRNIINGGGMRAFKGAMDHGVFSGDPEGMRAAYKLAEDIDKGGAVYGDILKSSAATDIMGTIKQRTFSKDDLSRPFAPEGLSETGLAAQYDFKQMLLQWALQNPEKAKNPTDREEAIGRIGKFITDRLDRKDEGTGEATYNRKGMEQLPNAYRPQDTPKPVPPPAAAPAPAPGTPTPDPASLPFENGRITDDGKGGGVMQFVGGDGKRYVQQLDPKTGWGRPQLYVEPAPITPTAAAAAQVPPPVAPPVEPVGGSQTPLTDALQNTEISKLTRAGLGEAGAAIADAVQSPQQFIEWMRGGGEQPPAGQTSGVGALMKTLGVENPQGFMDWLGKNLGVGQAKADVLPTAVDPPQQEMPGVGDAIPADIRPLIDPAKVDAKQWPKFDENATANPELAKAVASAIQEAIKNPTYKAKGVFTLSTLKNDPVANRILDFISGPESAGNYNAVWGNARNTEDLSKFSVGQILQRQAATVRKGGQSATGRYQFIRSTLEGLVDEMGIDPNTKFTPELQDTMALHLLNRRGLEAYRAGRMSLEKFGNNLALEWASMPNLAPQRGKGVGQSAYAGDGLNKAHVTPDAVKNILKL